MKFKVKDIEGFETHFYLTNSIFNPCCVFDLTECTSEDIAKKVAAKILSTHKNEKISKILVDKKWALSVYDHLEEIKKTVIE